MKRLILMVPAALALLVAAAVVLHGRDAGGQGGETRIERTGASPGAVAEIGNLELDATSMDQPSGATRRSNSANTVSGGVPLPPPDTPFAELAEALAERAQRGDARAACRLAAEMSRCRFALQTPDVEQLDEWFTRRAARRQLDEDEQAEAIAAHNALVQSSEQARALCAGVEPEALLRQPYYDLQAALAGDEDAALRFVSGQGLEPASLVQDPELARLYRDHALARFEALLATGRPETAWLWYAATQERSSRFLPISGVLPDSWDRPDVAAALFARLNEGNEHGIGAQFGGRNREAPSPEAQAEAEAMFERHFADSPHALDPQAARLRRTAPEVAHCDEL